MPVPEIGRPLSPASVSSAQEAACTRNLPAALEENCHLWVGEQLLLQE